MNYQLYEGDCLVEMNKIADGSIDAIICDLPYGTTDLAWDSVIPLDAMWKQFKRVIKHRGAIVLFGSQPFTSTLIGSNPEWFRYSWIWDKKIGGNPLIAKFQPLKTHEDILVFSKESHFYNPQMRKGHLRIKGGGHSKIWDQEMTKAISDQYFPTSILEFSNAVRGEHPTQKPTDLLNYLVRTYTQPGDTVLDATMGSGTTIVASLQNHRNGIGIERDANYFAIAKRRIEDAARAAAGLPKILTGNVNDTAGLPMFAELSI